MPHIFDFEILKYTLRFFGYKILIGKPAPDKVLGETFATIDLREHGCTTTGYPGVNERVIALAWKHQAQLVNEIPYVLSLSEDDYRHYLKPVDAQCDKDVM